MRRPARTRSVTSSVTTALVALLLAAPVGVLAGTAPAGAAPRDVRDGPHILITPSNANDAPYLRNWSRRPPRTIRTMPPRLP